VSVHVQRHFMEQQEFVVGDVVVCGIEQRVGVVRARVKQCLCIELGITADASFYSLTWEKLFCKVPFITRCQRHRCVWFHHSNVDLKMYEPPTELALDNKGEIPKDVWTHIFTFMDLQSASLLARVNKRFRAAFRDENAWRTRTRQHKNPPIELSKRLDTQEWIDFYQSETVWRITWRHGEVWLVEPCMSLSQLAAKL
jgi:hypothetical protein